MPEDHWHVNSQIDMNSFVEAAVYVPLPDVFSSNPIVFQVRGATSRRLGSPSLQLTSPVDPFSSIVSAIRGAQQHSVCYTI